MPALNINKLSRYFHAFDDYGVVFVIGAYYKHDDHELRITFEWIPLELFFCLQAYKKQRIRKKINKRYRIAFLLLMKNI